MTESARQHARRTPEAWARKSGSTSDELIRGQFFLEGHRGLEMMRRHSHRSRASDVVGGIIDEQALLRLQPIAREQQLENRALGFQEPFVGRDDRATEAIKERKA